MKIDKNHKLERLDKLNIALFKKKKVKKTFKWIPIKYYSDATKAIRDIIKHLKLPDEIIQKLVLKAVEEFKTEISVAGWVGNINKRIPHVINLLIPKEFPKGTSQKAFRQKKFIQEITELKVLRKKVFRQKGHQCLFCGEKKLLTIHHIIARGKEGSTDDIENLEPLCIECHNKIELMDFNNLYDFWEYVNLWGKAQRERKQKMYNIVKSRKTKPIKDIRIPYSKKIKYVAKGIDGWQRIIYGDGKTIYENEYKNTNNLWIKKALRRKYVNNK